MYITDKGIAYRVCDECGKRVLHDSPDILTGYMHEAPTELLDVCTRCAERDMVDVCHGGCMTWHYKSALNKDGLCIECLAEVIEREFDSVMVERKDVIQALRLTKLDEARVRQLCDEAVVRGADLAYLIQLDLK